MKSLYVITLALVAVCAAETYDTKNDNFDIKAVAADEQKLKAVAECFLHNDNGVCDPVITDFKNVLSEAIQQACAKCNPTQKKILEGFMDALQAKLPAEYEAFRLKYDPDNKYFGPLREVIKH